MKERLVVLGGGESGVGAAILGKKQGFEVFLSDRGVLKEKYRKELMAHQIEFEEGQHTIERILSANCVVKSPGIPKGAELIQLIRKENIPVISEIEFASKFTSAKIIAITGSNGKTTTASLVYQILLDAGYQVALGGNIGKSFAALVAEDIYEYFVLEISSFQLDDVVSFKPYIAILLNITPDHLDQYDNKLAHYARSKFRITANQSSEDYFVYNYDDSNILELIKEINTKAIKLPYSMNTKFNDGAYADDEKLTVNYTEKVELPIAGFSLKGKHNVSNTMAAATVANILKIKKESLKRSLFDFRAMEHRLEFILKVGGVEFINDSKATNVNAVYYALESMEHDTVWIVGGEDKGNDYQELMSLVKKKVKAIVCLGVDNTKIIDTFSDVIPQIAEAKSMEEAVKKAYAFAKKGDTVLLSPACASYDLFQSYEDRGNQFKNEVKKL